MDETAYQKQFIDLIMAKSLGMPKEEGSPLKEEIVPIGTLNFDRVVEIYANDYKWRLIDTLKANFKSLWMVLGDERFESLAFAYLKKHPSRSADINEYGEFFPSFIFEWGEVESDLSFLLNELALFELVFSKVFHSKEPTASEWASALSEEVMDSFFRTEDSVALLSFQNNVFSLFSYKEKTLEDFLNEKSWEEVARPSAYILYKKNSKVFCQPLSVGEFDFFKILEKGERTLGEALLSEISASPDEIQRAFLLIGAHFLSYLKRVDE